MSVWCCRGAALDHDAVHCPGCGTGEGNTVALWRDRSFGSAETFLVEEYHWCEALCVLPRLGPDEVAGYYHSNAAPPEYGVAPGWHGWLDSRRFTRRIESIADVWTSVVSCAAFFTVILVAPFVACSMLWFIRAFETCLLRTVLQPRPSWAVA